MPAPSPSTYSPSGRRTTAGAAARQPATRCTLKIWEKIARKAKELPPEKQQEALDFVEYLASRASQAGPAFRIATPSEPPPPPDDERAASWGPGRSPDDGVNPRSDSWDPGHIPGLDAWRTPPPRRRGRQAALAVLFILVLGAVGTYLYLRFGRDSGSPGVPPNAPPPVPPAAGSVTVAAPDAGPAVTPMPPVVPLAPPADAAPAPLLSVAPAPDAASPAVDGTLAPDAALVIPALVPPPDCGDELGDARTLWRSRDRDGALEKLRRALVCQPGALDPLLQWGKWMLETPALSRDRALAAEAADALGAAAETNPDHGQLWFHYTDLLFKAGRRDEAIAARTHCQSIRPANEYVSSCRFLPE